ncbi:MAG: HPr-rel-A system PqqD family protein [Pirellula sp.]|nr:HPr-rel-A system PqqD family protein [Pirellula sp.]
MSVAERLAQIVFHDDGFLFDPGSGESYVANPTAVAILRGLQEGRGEAALVADLTSRYSVDHEEARRDVVDFLSRLKNFQLV